MKWLEHTSGRRPVSPETMVRVLFEDDILTQDEAESSVAVPAVGLDWRANIPCPIIKYVVDY